MRQHIDCALIKLLEQLEKDLRGAENLKTLTHNLPIHLAFWTQLLFFTLL